MGVEHGEELRSCGVVVSPFFFDSRALLPDAKVFVDDADAFCVTPMVTYVRGRSVGVSKVFVVNCLNVLVDLLNEERKKKLPRFVLGE